MASRKIMFMVLALFLAVSAPAAHSADNGFYLGLKFIDSIQSTGNISESGIVGQAFDFDSYTQNTIGGGIMAGYDFYPQQGVPVRVELEYAIRTNSTTSWSDKLGVGAECEAKWNVQTLLANVYWDFHNDTDFTPYIGAGLGMAFLNAKYTIEVQNLSESESFNYTSFAWNVGAGCSWAITDHISADLAYRFLGLGHHKLKFDSGSKITMTPYANEFSLGLRYTF